MTGNWVATPFITNEMLLAEGEAQYYYTSMWVSNHEYGFGYCGVIDNKHVFAFQNNDLVQLLKLPVEIAVKLAVRAASAIISHICVETGLKDIIDTINR